MGGQWCLENGCDFVVSTGDNFYEHGVHSADDKRFETTWRDIYTHPGIADLTWYISAGNHDHGSHDDGREWFQVEYSKTHPRCIFQILPMPLQKMLAHPQSNSYHLTPNHC